MRQLINKAPPREVKLWQLCVTALVVTNALYFAKDLFGWVVILSFFLLVPGYLLLNLLQHQITSRWEMASFSLGLSLLLLMIGGLLLNELHAVGVARPLETPDIFITLDVVTLVLSAFNWKAGVNLPRLGWRVSKEQAIFTSALTTLPILAIGGAMRLNNGASDILTMVLFVLIPLVAVLLVWRKHLSGLYPYAIFTIAMAILFSTSLRGWSVTGHDIQHEFQVFQMVARNGFWNVSSPKGDPYNACLSITILPTIIAKITGISAPYIFKVVFQIVFAFCLVPVYYFLKRLGGASRALIGVLIFMSFPPFLNDLPFLNRQEIAFIFFTLLLLANFMNMARRPKTILTILCLLGLTLSHYSSGYVTLSLLLLSWVFFRLLRHKQPNRSSVTLPVLSIPILVTALLFTFLWNAQATGTATGLQQTITGTLQGLWGHSSTEASAVTYGLFAPPTVSPPSVLSHYAGTHANLVHYVAPASLPYTSLGRTVSHIISAGQLNIILRAFSAKILQLLLLFGLVLFFVKRQARQPIEDAYFYALALSCVVLLTLITLLPQLSVDYSVSRLFQQTLVITTPLIILAAEFLLRFCGRFKIQAVALCFALLFLDLSGFIPQLLGGYPPQLALNNAGSYYDIYYVHGGELRATQWLSDYDANSSVAADHYAAIRFYNYPYEKPHVTNPALTSSAQYFYQDYANVNKGLYGTFLSGDVIEYTYQGPLTNGSLVYVNQDSKIYHQ